MGKRLKDLKIAVLRGGSSAERDISLVTGQAVAEALAELGYEAIILELDRRTANRLLEEKVEFVFNALHGPPGEDGKVQGMLEVLGIPYSGSGVLASALAMNKTAAKRMFVQAGIATPDFLVWPARGEKPDIKEIKKRPGFPLVVKPSSQGSAIGVRIIREERQLAAGLSEAGKYGPVLLEKYLDGTELSVGVLGEVSLPVVEIIPRGEFYDYQAKYSPGGSQHIIPAGISEEVARAARELARKAHDALFCEVYSRTDMILAGGRLYVLEVNTLPGMTATSLMPEAARQTGVDFKELIERIIKLSLNKRSSVTGNQVGGGIGKCYAEKR